MIKSFLTPLLLGSIVIVGIIGLLQLNFIKTLLINYNLSLVQRTYLSGCLEQLRKTSPNLPHEEEWGRCYTPSLEYLREYKRKTGIYN
jgi:hypothetical protein